MTTTSWIYHLSATLALGITIAIQFGCETSPNTTLRDALGEENYTRLTTDLAEAETHLGFRFVLPGRLPASVSWASSVHNNDLGGVRRATVSFVPFGGQDSLQHVPTIIDLTEQRIETVNCPLCAEPGLSPIQVAGERALASEFDSASDQRAYMLYFRSGEAFITMRADWTKNKGDTVFDTQMKDEVRGLAETILTN